LPASDFTYGKRNRCPTPVDVILGNYYGSKAAEVQQKRYASQVNMVRRNQAF
jgi:6-phosphofructokinase